MCVNKREIVNPYTHRRLVVDCGKCPACLQQKADRRTLRIKNSLGKGEVALFVNFDYRNDCIPYIRKSELTQIRENKSTDLNVYRDCYARKLRIDATHWDVQYKHDTHVLTTHKVIKSSVAAGSFRSLQHYDPDKVGVVFYPDVQNFFKRLRINLKRKFNYDNPFKFFCTAEYGGKTSRPHFHLLIFVPQRYVETFRLAIATSWPFADSSRTLAKIEIARNAAAYVSSYVNSNRSVPSLFKSREYGFHQRHSYSHIFGVEKDIYSLPTVVKEYVTNRNLRRNHSSIVNGTYVVSSRLLPKYIVNRLFPKFKGFARLTSSQIYECCLRPASLAKYRERMQIGTDLKSLTTFANITTMLRNKLLYCFEQGVNPFDYAWTYANIYTTYNSELMKDMYKSQVMYDIRSVLESYDNLNNQNVSLLNIDIDTNIDLNCNHYKCHVIATNRLSKKYYNYKKDHEVRSHIYSQLNN